MPFSGPFRYYSIFVLLFVTIRRFGGPLHRISDSRSLDAVFATPTGYGYRKQLQNHRKQHI